MARLCARRLGVSFLALGFCAVLSSQGGAQVTHEPRSKSDKLADPELRTGSRIPVKPEAISPAQAAVLAKSFAKCIYRTSQAKATALLINSDLGSVNLAGARIRDLDLDLNMSRCLDDEVTSDLQARTARFPMVVLRDLVAEEAYLAANPVAARLATPPAAIRPRFVSTGPALAKAQMLHVFADCAIVESVSSADDLLRTEPGSVEERAAARALAPALGACLAEGQQIELTPRSIRSFVAYAMWFRFTGDQRQPKP